MVPAIFSHIICRRVGVHKYRVAFARAQIHKALHDAGAVHLIRQLLVKALVFQRAQRAAALGLAQHLAGQRRFLFYT